MHVDNMTQDTYTHPVVIVGLGQMGRVFAQGFLAAGYPVYPVTSRMAMADAARQMPDPGFVLLAVPENVISRTLGQVPDHWRGKLGLLQNELLPYVWEAEGIQTPTTMAVWFEKKKGKTVHVFRPTTVHGPHADLVRVGLDAVGIACDAVADVGQMVTELVKKNLYVLTINIAGLVVGGTTGELWTRHRDLVARVSHDVLDVMDRLTGRTSDREEMMRFMEDILLRVPDHGCRGRVAQDRLERMVATGRAHGLTLPALTEIENRLSG